MNWLLVYAPVLNLGILILILPVILYLHTQLRKLALTKFYQQEIDAVRARADRLHKDSELLIEALRETSRSMVLQTEAVARVSERLEQ